MGNPQSDRTGLDLPRGVKPQTVMDALQKGHGYQWIVLCRSPVLIAYGAPSHGENLPELLLTGNRTLVMAGGGPVYAERFRRVLEILQRQEPGWSPVKEEAKHE